MRIGILLGALVFTSALLPQVCAQKGGAKKTGQRARPASFACPDKESQKACDSYQELVKAKDAGISSVDDYRYVCFRKGQDEFFLINFSNPFFSEHWDGALKRMVVDSNAASPGQGFTATYKDGIQDSSLVPSLVFAGTWHYLGFSEHGNFISNDVNFQKNDPSELGVIQINEEQFSVNHYKYKNQSGENVDYSLTIQRSTGRFSETFLNDGKTEPLLEYSGRCVLRSH